MYAVPDDAVADRLEAFSGQLDGVAHLPRMPRAWLHFTVSRLAQFDDLPQRELTRLADSFSLALNGLGAFTLDVGAPRASVDSVGCWAASSPAWDSLVTAVREGARSAFPEELPPAPQAPHVTLAYATGDVDDDEVAGRLEGVPSLGEVAVRQVHLVSVTVRPERGTFDWVELANWTLPAS